MNFHIISLFPHVFDSYLHESILKRAIHDKKIKVSFYNPRDYEPNPKWRVDDRPYGGGPGMVIRALPVIKAIQHALGKPSSISIKALNAIKTVKTIETAKIIKRNVSKEKTKKNAKKVKIIFLSPSGKQFDTGYAKSLIQKKYTDIIIISGRYEGIDARVRRAFSSQDISIGPFVLTGGELPAMIMIDCIARQVEGVLGDFSSLEESRISSSEVYTRPEIFKYKNKTYRVPKVLLSGNPKKVNEWKLNRISNTKSNIKKK